MKRKIALVVVGMIVGSWVAGMTYVAGISFLVSVVAAGALTWAVAVLAGDA